MYKIIMVTVKLSCITNTVSDKVLYNIDIRKHTIEGYWIVYRM